MKSVVNQLCQLQDLILARDEHLATESSENLVELNQSIEEMTKTLPRPVQEFYQRLFNRNHVIMSPVHNSCCAVCGMRLPVSHIQAVRQCQSLQTCPGCSRILFEELDAPQWVGATPSRAEPRKNGISRFSAESLMVPDLLAGSAEDAIEVLAARMETGGFVSRADKLISAAMNRESIFSTAMEHGLAFPHIRGVEGGPLTLACGVSREPFTWDAEGSQVNIVFLITIPTAVSAFYTILSANLMRAFLSEANRKALLAAETPTALWKALTKATRYAIK
ncbi:MAG: PTS sugar transporter subunit IIA [Candidatus Spyradenecus sp.]